ncbi:unnamed protein product [Staurois parvus]|uniref:Uncharacterized protein n=1 Tax=Staurois parvus TaxID=386267 RepID=A0ABN9EH94_9NEOB|nr:unnamed protein product [Staurois parvus]
MVQGYLSLITVLVSLGCQWQLTVEHRSSDGTSVRGPDHVITDWPISDQKNSSKQDVTS